MENRFDFVELLGSDASAAVIGCFDDPADIARASSVSRGWRHFVIANGFCKKLCLRMYPEVSKVTRIVEVRNSSDDVELTCSNPVDWEDHLREHRIYMYLIRRIMSTEPRMDIMLDPIRASSTDNYPDESIDKTLVPSDRVDVTPSYWSSSGSRDPNAPETLIYRLNSRPCVVCEIKLRPFQAYFQYGNPIYSAKAVRFKMGHSKPRQAGSQISGLDKEIPASNFIGDDVASDDFSWTYVSPVFPMAQVNSSQSFKLPRPVLCIGGFLQIELLGRVQRQEMDNLYYICVCHVRVMGSLLFPEFDVDVVSASGEAELRYYPEFVGSGGEEADELLEETAEGFSGWQMFAERIRQIRGGGNWNHTLLNALLGHVPNEFDADTDEDGPL